MFTKDLIQTYFNKFLVIIGIIFVWFLLTFFKVVDPLFLSSPLATFQKLFTLFAKDGLVVDFYFTIYRAVFGFGIASFFGVLVGLVLGLVKLDLDYIFDFLRSIPATALFPLFLIVFGLGDNSKIFVITWACFFIILVNTVYGISYGSRIRLQAMRMLRLSKVQLIRDVIFFQALPQILSGLRLSVSMAILYSIVTEMFIGGNNGLGKRLMDAQLTYDISTIYAIIILIGLTGFLLNLTFKKLEERIVYWS
jgi:NitT/TauT family transport system permease protein